MDIDNTSADQRIKLRHLHCFVAIARLGSLQRAADELAISQPAISKTLVELEEKVGVTLFTRGRQGAQLTRDGQRLLPYAMQSIAALRDGLHALSTPDDPQRAQIRFGVLPTLSAILVPPAFAAMSAAWRDLALEVVTAPNTELLEAVRQGDIEFAINRAADPEQSEGLRFTYLYDDPLVVVTRPGHPVGRSGLREAAASGRFAVVLPPTGTLIRQSADQLLDASGMDQPAMVLETLSMSTARVLALEHDAIWLVPRSAVARDIGVGALAVVPASVPGSAERVGITTRRNARPAPAVKALIAHLKEIASNA